jgi:hypothetical protein
MKKRLKGDGKLSRKLLTILVLAVMPMLGHSVIAAGQVLTPATGPNSVYIEQLGSSNTITIQQIGGSNNIGGTANITPSDTNYATVNGSSNVLGITQTGDNNLGQYSIKGNNNTYNSTVTGSNNTTTLTMGNLNTNTLRSTVTETITGSDNKVIQNVVGNDITSTLTLQGSNNQVTKNLLSSNGSSTIGIQGNYNFIDAQQTDAAGGMGHVLVQNIVGDYNSIVTQQQGNNDTTVNIATTGSHNAITVRTSSSSIVSPVTAVAR